MLLVNKAFIQVCAWTLGHCWRLFVLESVWENKLGLLPDYYLEVRSERNEKEREFAEKPDETESRQ